MILPRTVVHLILLSHPHLAVVCRHIRFRHHRLLLHHPFPVVCHILPFSTSSSSISEVVLGSDGEVVTIPGRDTRAGTELLWHTVPSSIDTIPLEQFLSGDNGSVSDHSDI